MDFEWEQEIPKSQDLEENQVTGKSKKRIKNLYFVREDDYDRRRIRSRSNSKKKKIVKIPLRRDSKINYNFF